MAKRQIPWAQRCGAKRTNGEPCKSWAMRGCTRCRLHGGLTPGAQKKAPERLEIAARAAIQPAIDALIERLTTGPRHKRLAVALSVLTTAGLLDEETADMIDPMKSEHPVAEEK